MFFWSHFSYCKYSVILYMPLEKISTGVGDMAFNFNLQATLQKTQQFQSSGYQKAVGDSLHNPVCNCALRVSFPQERA